MIGLANELVFAGKNKEALETANKAASQAKKISWERGIVYTTIAIGNVYEFSSQPDKAVAAYFKAEKKAKELNVPILLSSCYSNLGSYYYQLGDVVKAQKYFQQMLVTGIKSGDQDGQARAHNNLGATYEAEKEYKKAIKSYKEAIRIYKKQKNERNIADAYNNIGNVYFAIRDYEEALVHLRWALSGYIKSGDKQGYSIAAGNISNTFTSLFNQPAPRVEKLLKTGKDSAYNRQLLIDSSIYYANAAIKINRELNDLYNLAHNLKSLGNSYVNTGRYTEAMEVYGESLRLSTDLSALVIQRAATEGMAHVNAGMGNYKDAYQWILKHNVIKDSIFSQEKQVEAGRQQGRFETEKQLALDAMKHQKDIAAEKKQQLLIIIFSCIVIAVVVVFLVISFNRLKITRRQKKIIEQQKHQVLEQKEIVEEKNKEITDSINYAKRIQLGILPSEQELTKALGDHFVLYLPKDIVSGDFYWAISTTTTNTGIKLSVFAAVDCTGHGVPGAIMSMLGKTLLNQTVKNPDINSPADVLNFLNAELPKNLKSHEANTRIRDGMDVGLCALNSNAKKLYFAGANNPCWIARNHEIIELEPDKHAVSASEESNKVPFNNTAFDLQAGDMVYLFTDGYADQFGGPKGKKFKYSQLKELISEISGENTVAQREKLKDVFFQWKGNYEQTDDVCILGVRV
ncbi:MAG TPA: tetratricopeptide repeat protein [Flavobacteriales bacterium]|nr:tetratricopeptide repeat protein [Flavobacteriales bacterium]